MTSSFLSTAFAKMSWFSNFNFSAFCKLWWSIIKYIFTSFRYNWQIVLWYYNQSLKAHVKSHNLKTERLWIFLYFWQPLLGKFQGLIYFSCRWKKSGIYSTVCLLSWIKKITEKLNWKENALLKSGVISLKAHFPVRMCP